MGYKRPPERIYLTKDKSKVGKRAHGSWQPNYDTFNIYNSDGFERTIVRHRPTGKIATIRRGKDSELDAFVRLRKRVEPDYRD